MRATYFLAALSLAAFGAGSGSAAAHESYRLHVQSHKRSGLRAVDIDVPWDALKGGSPFNFTDDSVDDIKLERLSAAWAALRSMPEGTPVMIETRSETIKAWRHGEDLVLAPRPRDRGEDHHSRIRIPGDIIDTILAHDGRLTADDVERLARKRGGTVTLVAVKSDNGGVTVWIGREREGRDEDD